MPFRIIGRMGPGMRQVVGFGDRCTRRGTLGANFGRAIVTNGDFTAYVCDSAARRPSSEITLGKLVMFNTDNMDIIQNCQHYFALELPHNRWAKRVDRFEKLTEISNSFRNITACVRYVRP